MSGPAETFLVVSNLVRLVIPLVMLVFIWLIYREIRKIRILPRPLGQVTRPVVHQDTPAVEQVRPG